MKKIQKALFISIFLFAAGILASAQIYTWTGGHGNFKNPSNWSPNLPAGTTPTAFPAGTYKILSAGPCFLTDNITFAGTAQIEVGSEINDGKFQLANYALRGTVVVTVNKKGTLELSGTDEHRNLFSGGKITLKTDSTVVYYGNTGKDIWQGAYQNLIVRGPIQAQSLTVNKTMTIERNPPAENPPIQITAPVQTYNGDVTVLTNTEFRAATSVTFGSAGTVSGTGSIIVPNNGTVNIQKNINLTGTASKFEQTGTGAVNIGGNASSITAATQIYKGAVSVNADTAFEAGTALTFESAVFGSLKNIVIKGKDITFNSVVSAVDLTVMNKNGGTLTIKKNITVSNSLIQKDVSPPYSPLGPVVIDSNSDVTITAPKQVYNGAVTLKANTTFSAGAPSGPLALQFEKAVASPAHKNIVLETVTSTGIKTEQSVSAGKITVRNGTGNSSRWESYGIVSAEDDIEVAGVWQHSASGNITAKGNVKAGTFKQTTPGSTLIFAGNDTQTLEVGSSSQIQRLKNTASLKLNSDIKIIETFENNGSFAHNDKTVTFNSLFSKISGTREPTFFNLTIATGAELKTEQASVKISGTFTNNGTFTHNNKKVIFNGLLSKIAGSTETEFYKLTVDANKILHLEQNIIVVDTFENGGIFKARGNTVTLAPASTAANIQGKNTATDTEFAAISCLGAGGKTLTINGKIMVANLKIGGASELNKLTVQGGASSEITLTSDQTPDSGTKKGYYLDVNTNIPIADGKTYYVAESVLGNPNPKNWEHMSSTWKTNATTTNWNTASNWTPELVPAAGWPVIIPAGGTKYPKLTANVKAKTITLAPGAKLDLADYVITKSNLVSDFTPITNNGTLRMKGTSSLTDPKGQKEWLESTVLANQITHGTTSVIEYYSTANNPLWRGPYQNLTVSEGRTSLTPINPGSGSTAADLTVENTFTVAANAGDNFIITANSQLYKQTVSLRKKTTFSSFGGTGTVFKGSVLASGIDIGFSGNGLIKTESTVTAKDIIVNPGINTWTSSGTITAQDITVQRAWTSTGNVTANGYITANDWTAKNVTLKGNLTAVQFNQTGGTLTFNSTGTPEQELNFTGAGDKNIFDLTIDTGANVKLLSPVTIVRNITNYGIFDADTHTVTLDNNNSHTITGTSYGDNTKKTEFHNLECTGATGKTLTINRKITVENALKLSGGGTSNRLIINGTGKISLKTDHSGHTDPSRQFLKIDTRNLEVLEKPYVVNQSVDHNGKPKSHNGWVFYKDPATISIENSLAKPGDEYIYLVFSNTSHMSEEELKFIGKPPYNCKLIITGGSTTYESSLQDVSPANPEKTLWKIKLDKEIKANDILKPSCQVVLNYFGTSKTKPHISDIGINIVKPQKAFNSIVLRTFNANPDDKALPTLDITIPTERESTVTSDNFKLYFISKDAPGRFWHPDTITSPPGSFANPQSGTTEYTGTPAGGLLNFIIPSTDPYLKEGKVGQFMYVYDGWLPCARLKDETGNDILSLDVWNFKIVGIQIQKGGVSIFENVVNPYKGQSATIAAHLKKSGMLTIQIMTLDGNIVRTLTRSHHNAGDHFYLWDGRNNGGNPVASGMYFVRIAGPDIDEVRKILIIK
ncbi:FlgD immunoglobulin-like domain containing protein [Treponema denticola]|uniref:FlgD immunoglobulin-like domain containing protein n=1 Tax=Treponema denticola TaxID=158 RepID=UPI003D930C5D